MSRVRTAVLLGCFVLVALSVASADAGSVRRRASSIGVRNGTVRASAHQVRLHGYLIRPRARISIVNGTDAVAGTWGFMARIVHFDAQQTVDFWCSGTLITPTVVLTAAHCATAPTTGDPLRPSQYLVVTGAVDTHDPTAQWSHVDEVVVHPNYDPRVVVGQAAAGDAALLVLSTPSTAQPVRLARADEPDLYAPGADVTIAGWGLMAGGDASSVLQVAPTNIQTSNYCARFWQAFDPAWDACAAQTKLLSTATCGGDSGGPLLTYDAAGNPVELGVLSVGPTDCATDQADYYTRSDVIGDWVTASVAAMTGPQSTSTSSSSSGTDTSTSTTSTTTTTTTTATSRTSTATSTTSTSMSSVALVTPKKPVEPVQRTLPTLTMGDVHVYAARLVQDRTHRRPRLAMTCHRVTRLSVNCAIRWQAAGASYAISGSFYHYLEGRHAHWWYDFGGTRRWTSCRVRHDRRICTSYIERFRWA